MEAAMIVMMPVRKSMATAAGELALVVPMKPLVAAVAAAVARVAIVQAVVSWVFQECDVSFFLPPLLYCLILLMPASTTKMASTWQHRQMQTLRRRR
jgi:hypothetical protein